MNGHDILKLAGGVMALALYAPMTVEIVRARGAGQSFATWGLWAVLDTILTITLWQQHGNYLLSLGFALGGVALAAVLLWQGSWSWGRFETVIALMVLASLAVWKFSGPRNATIAKAFVIPMPRPAFDFAHQCPCSHSCLHCESRTSEAAIARIAELESSTVAFLSALTT